MRILSRITQGCAILAVAFGMPATAPLDVTGVDETPLVVRKIDQAPGTAKATDQSLILDRLGLQVDRTGIVGPVAGDLVTRRWLNAESALSQVATSARPSPHALAECDAPVRIGMVDTPINRTHPDLETQSIQQWSSAEPGPETPSWTHGTAIASLLVSQTHGLLRNAELYAAAALQQQADGSLRLDLLAFMQALDWLASNDVKVVNLSFETAENPVLSLVLARAAERGLILTAAAGNGGAGAQPAHPAAHPDVIAVTAVDRRHRIYRHANRGAYIDFAAPGVNVEAPGPRGTRRQSGTSLAAPFVAAAAAGLIQAGTRADPASVRAALKQRAEDLGPPGHDETYGWGYVDPERVCG